MNILRNAAIAVALLAGLTAAAVAETKVTISNMHLCCGACVKAVNNAVGGVEGAEVAVDKDAKSAVVTAKSAEAAQAAVNAIAKAGFHGKTDNDDIKMASGADVADANVKRMEFTNVHNCCGGCNVAIKKAVESVDGVEANTAKPKSNTFVVEGDFNALALVKALHAAGFHVGIKK